MLSQQEYFFSKWARNSINTSVLESKKDPINDCLILPYELKEVVTCLDVLHHEFVTKHSYLITKKTGKETKLHFVFMGDSRIRQQFINFLRVSKF
jgi:hypothetical protein